MTPSELLINMAGEAQWDEILIATAYVDTASLDTLRRMLRRALSGRDRSRKITVTFLTGRRDHLNRVRTLKALLAIEAHPPRAIDFHATCPKEPFFHAKCYLFRAPRRWAAIVGSFNWTKAGLEGRGECWVRLDDSGAVRQLFKTLTGYRASAIPWKEEIKDYKERRIVGRGPAGPRPLNVADVARTIEDLEDASVMNERVVNRLIKEHQLKRIRPRIQSGDWILHQERLYGELKDEYVPNAWFDSDWAGKGWAVGARRELGRVAYTLRYPSGGIVIFRRQLIPYQVTPRLASAAKRLGIRQIRRRPSQRDMLNYIKLVKAERGRRKKK